MSDTRVLEAYFIASLITIATVMVSLGSALLYNVGPQPLPQALGAAVAWAVGTATGLWFIPWVKQAVPRGVTDE